ncbi:MAG: hypothetical protein U5K74_00735 [Gemmatimonadaceae bacterium]|nr:hypothetical protein [Gemmatimonadaceae bacterium]
MLRRPALVVAALLLSMRLGAQGPTVTAARTTLEGCTYDACALRLDRSFFGGRKVVVGLDGQRLPMGAIGGGLVTQVARVPGAADEARAGRGNALKAAIGGVIGTIASVVALNQFDRGNSGSSNDGVAFGALGVGVVASITAGVQAQYAERHFSRAVWLYNRELPR